MVSAFLDWFDDFFEDRPLLLTGLIIFITCFGLWLCKPLIAYYDSAHRSTIQRPNL